MKKLLITSNYKETWILEKNFKRYFLSAACLESNTIYDSNNHHEKIIKYHWDERNKLRKDFDYLDQFYEKVLMLVSHELNLIHNTQNSLVYWRIIIGPWLLIYLHSCFDKWEMLRIAFETHSTFYTVLNKDQTFVSNDFEHFNKINTSNYWNFNLCSRIIKSYYNAKINNKEYVSIPFNQNENPHNKSIKHYLKLLFSFILNNLSSNNKVLFILDKLPFLRLIKLNFNLGQLPNYYYGIFKTKIIRQESYSEHRKRKLALITRNPFEEFISKNLLLDIPLSYIENYNLIKKRVNKIKINPLLIFSDIKHFSNDTFKIWVSEQIKKGKKFYSVVHGGSIPFLFHPDPKHDFLISSKNITLYKALNNKQYQLPPYFITKGKSKNYSGKYCSLIGYENFTYAFRASSMPIANKTIDVFNLSVKFCLSLNIEVYRSLRIRPFINCGWNTSKLYKETLSDVKIESSGTLQSFIKNSKLIICSYPQTTFSQAMATGIPTILLCETEYNEHHNDANELVNLLKSAKIYFTDPIEAAKHVNKYWDKIDFWWSSQQVKNARNYFYENALKINNNWLNDWSCFIKKEISGFSNTST